MHVAPQTPPQSMSDSVRFKTPSEQVAASQNPLVQTRLAQSAAAPHFLPSTHVAHPEAGPPQSLSDSVPFNTPSAHVGSWQTKFVHTVLAQSAGTLHTFIAAQSAHVPPPQSVSVSVPFLIKSLQVAPAHLPPLHESVVQSAPTRQRCVSLQAGQAPPQSTSLSVPFFSLSSQTAGLHRKSVQTC